MKRNGIIAALCLLWTINAHALIVSVNGQGEIDERMEVVLTEAEEDLLTGDKVMKIEGDLLTSHPLTVSITRSAIGLTDEFCCAGQCTFGNGEQTEELHFSPNGIANWYIHYTPQAGTDETITYHFDDGESQVVLVVEFKYEVQGLETVDSESQNDTKKVLENGIIYIIHKDKKYTL